MYGNEAKIARKEKQIKYWKVINDKKWRLTNKNVNETIHLATTWLTNNQVIFQWGSRLSARDHSSRKWTDTPVKNDTVKTKRKLMKTKISGSIQIDDCL